MVGRFVGLFLFLALLCLSFKSAVGVPSEDSENECRDIDPDCPYYADVCEESFVASFVNENCQETCGLCVSNKGKCFDLDSDCPNKPYVCKLKSHRSYAEKLCQKTCKYCTDELDSNEV